MQYHLVLLSRLTGLCSWGRTNRWRAAAVGPVEWYSQLVRYRNQKYVILRKHWKKWTVVSSPFWLPQFHASLILHSYFNQYLHSLRHSTTTHLMFQKTAFFLIVQNEARSRDDLNRLKCPFSFYERASGAVYILCAKCMQKVTRLKCGHWPITTQQLTNIYCLCL